MALSLAPQAVAATASVEPVCGRGETGAECSGRLVVRAGPGERNRVTFDGLDPYPDPSDDAPPPSTIQTVVDRGAPLRAGAGCVQVSANEVRCDANRSPYRGGIEVPLISTGDGADRVTIPQGDITVRGGSGNDRIVALLGFVRLSGGAGKDRIRSTSPFGGVLEGGRGNDAVSAAEVGHDLSGGSGNDRLTGSADGDEIDGGSGRDRIRAGDGADEIVSRDRSRDRVNCGKGRDRLRADRRDRARRCERVRRR